MQTFPFATSTAVVLAEFFKMCVGILHEIIYSSGKESNRLHGFTCFVAKNFELISVFFWFSSATRFFYFAPTAQTRCFKTPNGAAPAAGFLKIHFRSGACGGLFLKTFLLGACGGLFLASSSHLVTTFTVPFAPPLPRKSMSNVR